MGSNALRGAWQFLVLRSVWSQPYVTYLPRRGRSEGGR